MALHSELVADRGPLDYSKPHPLIVRVTVSGYGLVGYLCARCTPSARKSARDYIARHGFAEAFK